MPTLTAELRPLDEGRAGVRAGDLPPDFVNDSMLDCLCRSVNGVGDGARVRAPVADNADAVYSQELCAPHFLVVRLPLDAVSVKFKTAEKVGPVGLGQSCEAQAAVLVYSLET